MIKETPDERATQAEAVAKYRRTVAFSTRPEVTAAITASLDGTAEPRPVAEL